MVKDEDIPIYMYKYQKDIPTYWDNKGKYQKLSRKLDKLIPFMGPVDKPYKNKALERYRKASNAYYDFYNNALANRAKSFVRFFSVSLQPYRVHGKINPRLMYSDKKLIAKVEKKMDQIILDAAKEQGLI